MTEGEIDKLSQWAIVVLALISLVAIVCGIVAATVYGREVEGVVAIATGAVGGIVAIVLRDKNGA